MSKPTQEGIRWSSPNAFRPCRCRLSRGRCACVRPLRTCHRWRQRRHALHLCVAMDRRRGRLRGSSAGCSPSSAWPRVRPSGSLRFRVCRNGVTVDQLAGLMSGIVVSRTAKETANELLVNAKLSSIGAWSATSPAPIRRLQLLREKPPARRRVVTRPAAEPPPAPREMPKPRARAVPALAPAPTPLAPPAVPGVRYLAPVAPGGAPSSAPPSAPAAPRIPVPQAQPRVIVPSPVAARQTLDPSLPAAAYAGPSRRRGR